MLVLAFLTVALGASPSALLSSVISEDSTTDEPVTREIGCNSTVPVFSCDEFKCVSKASVCNGVPDCPDGQDESVQECGSEE